MIDDEWMPAFLDIEKSSYSAAEFLEWHSAGKLELSPDFQRGEVWKTPAKAFLIDTMLRNFPIPPLHIRMRSRSEKGLVREVIDGQQRLTAVIQFLENNLTLAKPRGAVEELPPWAGKKYRQLEPELQQRVENYPFRCEVYRGNIEDQLVYEIFTRINMHSVPLSEQELRNGRYFGEFKHTVYRLAREQKKFWEASKLFTTGAIARMLDAQFVSEVLVLHIAGQQDKKSSLNPFYAKYDESWPERNVHEARFRATIDAIRTAVGEVLPSTAFSRIALFYSLYATIYHRVYGIESQLVPPGETPLPRTPRAPLSEHAADRVQNAVVTLSDLLSEANPQRSGPYGAFIRACSQQTDNIRPRLIRFRAIWELARLEDE